MKSDALLVVVVCAGVVGAAWSLVTLVRAFRVPREWREARRSALWATRRRILLKGGARRECPRRAVLLSMGRSFSRWR
jgi:hypothetical protein